MIKKIVRNNIFFLVLFLSSGVASGQNFNPFNTDESLIAYYPFNGNANDQTGKSANGIVNGAVLADDRHGVHNAAFKFSGINDYIRIDNTAFDRTKSYTFSLWFKSDSVQEASELFVLGGNGHVFLQMRDSTVGFNTFLNGQSTPSEFDGINLDVWYQVVGTYDRQTGIQVLYLNGLKVAENNYGQYDSFQPNSSYSSVGSYYYPFVKRNFSGSIDDIRIFNRALTDQEVQELYEIEFTKPELDLNEGLVVYYPFNGDANDISGNSNHGIVNGPVLTYDRFGNSESAYYFTQEGVSFGKSHQSIYIPHNTQFSTREYSLSIWVRAENYGWTGNSRVRTDFITKREKSDISGQASFALGFTELNSFTSMTPCTYYYDTLALNEWVHLSSTFDGETLTLYIDGNLVIQENCDSNNNVTSTSGIMLGQNWQYNGYWYHLQGAIDDFRYWNRALTEEEVKILYELESLKTPLSSASIGISDSFAKIGELSEVNVYTNSKINLSDSLSSFQLKIPVPEGLKFDSVIRTGTLSEDGVLAHNMVNDTLRISFASSNYISGDSVLVGLSFEGSIVGEYELKPVNAFLNATNIESTLPGIFTVVEIIKGDVDGDGNILAYDASLVLKYSTGKDPIPNIDPLPWVPWRVIAADVDEDGQVLAIDASLILQKIVNLIDSFPTTQQDEPIFPVDVRTEGEYLVFSTEESGLRGFNAYLPKIDGIIYQQAEFLEEDVLTSEYSTESSYNVAIASIAPMMGDFLRIPISSYPNEPITIKMYSNASDITAEVSIGTSIETDDNLPKAIILQQNYPNPFNPSTTISYYLPNPYDVKIEVFSSLGQRVAVVHSGLKSAGYHSVIFDASGLSSGIYLYRITAANKAINRKMLLMK